MAQLSDTRIREAKPKDKSCKIFDERGLYLIIDKSGRGHWRLRYYLRGKEKLISLGPYPYVSLKRAREKRDEARTLIVEGIDPAAKRKAEKLAEGETFEAIAEEWLNLQTRNLKLDTLSMLRAHVRTYLNPYIGSQPGCRCPLRGSDEAVRTVSWFRKKRREVRIQGVSRTNALL
jgi:TusA-related sulfurtransferase